MLYNNGELKSVAELDENILHVDLYSGFLLTDSNKLYAMYTDANCEEPEINFVYIDVVDELQEVTYLISETGNYLPIILKDNKKYTVLPEDWNTFERYSLGNSNLDVNVENPNYNLKLVELKDYFESAEFSMGYYSWKAKANFNLNKEIFSAEYSVNGFDSRCKLSDSEIEELTVTVNSIDEFWKHIDKIRRVYSAKYDYREVQ